MILLDSLEPESIKLSLPEQLGQKVKVVTLEAGDIMLWEEGKTMLIERKAVLDLLNSMGDGSLVDQCARISSICELPVLLCHGDLKCNRDGKVVADGRETGWDWWSMHMQLFSLQVGGIIYLHVRKGDLADAIKYLQGWLRKDEHLRVQRRDPMPFIMNERERGPLRILMSLPDVGETLARECLEYYGTAGWALAELTQNNVHRPRGIGKVIPMKVREALGLNEAQVLSVETKEREDE
jgi:ERCC4-type nuclease